MNSRFPILQSFWASLNERFTANFSDISDDVLFLEVGKTVKEFPFCGENMVMQLLKQRGFRVQRWRLRDALYTLYETGIHERKKGGLQRRVYNVKGPNPLWHIDTNHKLIRWHFVIVGGIDGYSRLVTFFYSERTIINLLLSWNVFYLAFPNLDFLTELHQIKV
jgi:hypothetical protein